MGNSARIIRRTGNLINPSSPDLIAPINVVGKGVKDDQAGIKLAGFLAARMHELNRDLQNSVIVFDFSPLQPTARLGTEELFQESFEDVVAPSIMVQISTNSKVFSM